MCVCARARERARARAGGRALSACAHACVRAFVRAVRARVQARASNHAWMAIADNRGMQILRLRRQLQWKQRGSLWNLCRATPICNIQHGLRAKHLGVRMEEARHVKLPAEAERTGRGAVHLQSGAGGRASWDDGRTMSQAGFKGLVAARWKCAAARPGTQQSWVRCSTIRTGLGPVLNSTGLGPVHDNRNGQNPNLTRPCVSRSRRMARNKISLCTDSKQLEKCLRLCVCFTRYLWTV